MAEYKEVAVNTAQYSTTVLAATGQFIPVAGAILGVFATIFREILDLTERAEHNKKVCRRLAERVRVANNSLSKKQLQESDPSLELYKNAITECKEYIARVSKLSSFMKLYTAKEVEYQFNEVTKCLDGAVLQLGLEQVVRTRQDIEDDGKLLRSEIKTTLTVIEEVMKNVFSETMNINRKVEVLDEKIDAIHDAVNNINNVAEPPTNLKQTQIQSSHIKEVEDEDHPEVRGNGQVKKKLYIAQFVSEKEIGHIDSLPRSLATIERQVAILTELKDCEYILKFYGTMQRSGRLYIISEWADSGDLNTYLKSSQNLPWSFKIRIASEIASGLVFCHTFDILHHDIRSNNILLTERLQAKISNFSSSRKETDDTSQVKDITFRYRWLAPEKLVNYSGNEYTKQCDIYSFAIVLWELASQRVPFEEITIATKLISTITAGGRPQLVPGTPHAYDKIMQQGWSERPIKRPAASHMFKELSALNRPSLHTDTQHTYSSSTVTSISAPINDYPNDSPSENPVSSSIDPIPLEPHYPAAEDSGQVDIDLIRQVQQRSPDVPEAKRLHNQKLYSQAWPIFKQHADRGDAIAEFYVGYYLIAGDRSVPQDTKTAVEYFRRSAEKGVPDAQFRYGVALLNGEGVEKSRENDRIAIENLQKAAKSGNPNAMFNYGDLLINGAHGVPEDLEEGTKWMQKAHDRGHPHAYKKLADRLRHLGKPVPEEVTEGLKKMQKGQHKS